MKKILVLLMSFLMIVMLAACAEDGNKTDTPSTQAETLETETAEAPATEPESTVAAEDPTKEDEPSTDAGETEPEKTEAPTTETETKMEPAPETAAPTAAPTEAPTAAPTEAPIDTLEALIGTSDYMYVDQDFFTGNILGVYYLVPNEEKTGYKCYSSDLSLYSTVPYKTAKQLIDDTLGNMSINLPQEGGRSTIIWNSPYGFCAYQMSYRDYHSLEKVDEAGNIYEEPIDISLLPYILNEEEVLNIYQGMNLPETLTIPKSSREE